MSALSAVQRRLDTQALDQLRTEAARLHAENEQLLERLSAAESDADWYHGEWLSIHLELCEARGGAPGIIESGALVVIPGVSG